MATPPADTGSVVSDAAFVELTKEIDDYKRKATVSEHRASELEQEVTRLSAEVDRLTK